MCPRASALPRVGQRLLQGVLVGGRLGKPYPQLAGQQPCLGQAFNVVF
jgi:hypothetical protein